MGKTIAIANQKGGVGKTTTAVNLSSCLAVAEKRTLLIDIDPQANSCSGLGIERDRNEATIYDVLVDNVQLKEIIVSTSIPYLQVAPSNINLTGAELELVSTMAREAKLKKAVLPMKEEFDFVIVDCPPSLGLLTLNTLTAADSVIIPIQCEYYALEGLSQLLNMVRLVQKNLNQNLEIEGVLLTMFDSRLNLSKQVAKEVKDYFGDKVYASVIPRNVRLSEAPSFGKPIILYDIFSTGAKGYMKLAKEVIERCKNED
jgi:chromosome partitioning protein